MNNTSNTPFLSEDYFEDYYLKLKSNDKNILIKRKDKNAALRAYHYYKSMGKEIEWQGKWNGHQFEVSSIPISMA